MGLLVDGVWHDQWYDTDKTGGRFQRQDSAFRNWVTSDGSPGPSGKGGFKAEAGRYHLYVALACPWCHRVMIMRRLKKLGKLISVSIVNSYMGEQGWSFAPGRGVVEDIIHNADYLHQVYTAAKPDYSGRVVVPVLWDRQTETIVSNESSEIMRMFNSAFDGVGAVAGDYYPQALREQINELNEVVYQRVNNGVYKAGFATAQQAYEEAVLPLFETLDMLEQCLSEQRYLLGATLTETDWRLFVTLVRFDSVYVGHFKCNVCRIEDYPNLSNYLRDLYQVPGVAETVDLVSCKEHYYSSHKTINPTCVVPVGPALDLARPHDRNRFS
ncbi:MAG: glutathione S-transferase family protein [Gammaproteobacteria bacterium]|jgi:putative glutathione S-transferase|nr:glutathione S-transferase family protein [Gammaproteobacteria bacterium]